MIDIFEKDALWEASFLFCNKNLLTEMAINRSDLERVLQPQIHHILKHFVKLEAMPDSRDVGHWKGEIKGAFARFQGTRYSHNNKKPTVDQWMVHTKHNALPEHSPALINQLHSDLTDDGEYQNVSPINPHQTHLKFEKMLRRCFTKINNNVAITQEDIH